MSRHKPHAKGHRAKKPPKAKKTAYGAVDTVLVRLTKRQTEQIQRWLDEANRV